MTDSVNTILAPDAEILVVDDNELNLKVACGLLSLSKIKAKTALSGKEAIEMVRQNKFDLVFMDQKMPDMNGDEVTAQIRKLGAEYESLPIVALTASVLNGAKGMFLSKGFDDFISKPVDLYELYEILIRWLPPEKISGESAEEKVDPGGPACFIKGISAIGEIDIHAGLRYVSGKEDMYRENVEFFCEGLLAKCYAMAVHLNGGETGRFLIEVHSMKTSLATIGATGLSEAAAWLETAASNGNVEHCASKFPAFYKRLAALHKSISDVFRECG